LRLLRWKKPEKILRGGYMPIMSSNKDFKGSSFITLSKEITTKLLHLILDGTYPAGTKLPTERDMATEYGVTRHVIREALKRLEVMNLITIRQGSGIYVEDYTTSGCVDLMDYLLFGKDGVVDFKFLKDIIEFHSYMAVIVIELAAQRIQPEELQRIKDLVKELNQIPRDSDKEPEIFLQIIQTFIQGAHNKYINLMFNTALRIDEKFEVFFKVISSFFHESQHYIDRIIESLENRDAEMAKLQILRVTEHHKNKFIEIIDQLYKNSV
jgi:DNA-binding FadR family transcriptional regulator